MTQCMWVDTGKITKNVPYNECTYNVKCAHELCLRIWPFGEYQAGRVENQ